MPRIYTKTGGAGETGLLAGIRVRKDDPRVEAYGTLDELNSALGVARASLQNDEVNEVLEGIQHDLFAIGAEVASPGVESPKIPRCSAADVERLEVAINRFEDALPPLREFILPGGTSGGSLLHFARTICRRAERRMVRLAGVDRLNPEILRYLNRLSDLLFVLARTVNHRAGAPERAWRPP